MRRQHGFTYVIVMFAVAVSSIVAVRAVETAATNERRQKEEDLLWIGRAYYEAIRNYYENSPGTVKTLPASLDALLLDDRTSTMRRHLRKLYRDPITGSEQWGVIKTDDGKVAGVYSLSAREPFKTGGFRAEFSAFANAKTYSDWQFKYVRQ